MRICYNTINKFWWKFNFKADKSRKNMKVNMNVIVGGTDDVLDNILSAARTVRKELKASFESIEIDALQKMDVCVCFSGNVSKYYPESGIYEAKYYSKTKKFIVYVHFSSNEWNSNDKENVSKFIKLYNDYLLQLSDIIKMKIAKSKLEFDNKSYEEMVKRTFENL